MENREGKSWISLEEVLPLAEFLVQRFGEHPSGGLVSLDEKSIVDSLDEVYYENQKLGREKESYVTIKYRQAKIICERFGQREIKYPPRKEHPHLDHNTRDEDNEGGWCDTCQDTFEGNTGFVAGWNAYDDEVKKLNPETKGE